MSFLLNIKQETDTPQPEELNYDVMSRYRFKCDLCKQSFARMSRLLIHQRRSMYKCAEKMTRSAPMTRDVEESINKPTSHRDGGGDDDDVKKIIIKAENKCDVTQKTITKPASDHEVTKTPEHVNNDSAVDMTMKTKTRDDQETTEDTTTHVADGSSSGEDVSVVTPSSVSHNASRNGKGTKGGVRLYKCTMCEKRFFSARLRRIHCNRFHKVKEFKCEQCDKQYTSLAGLQLHYFAHTGEKPFKCAFCDYATITRAGLNCHERTHTGETPYNCLTCERQFTTSSQRLLHSRYHCKGARNKVVLTCDVCNKRLSSARSLALHVKTHTGDGCHTCEFCGLLTANRNTLKTHYLLHTNQKPYKCSICPYSSARSGDLTIHMRTHTDERPYVCKQCSFAFKTKSQLICHMRKHSGAKPYKCTYCERTFGQPNSLTKHLYLHTGERPHRCTICQKGFTRRYRLNEHVMKTHNVQVVQTDADIEAQINEQQEEQLAVEIAEATVQQMRAAAAQSTDDTGDLEES